MEKTKEEIAQEVMSESLLKEAERIAREREDNKRIKTLKELESRVEDKISELKRITDEISLSGKSEAGKIPIPLDPETIKKNRVNDYLKGTGLSI